MYSHLVLGGTFDHLHAGHEKLLRTAFSLSKHVLLGLTQPEMNKNKAWADSILSYEERKREIEAFARREGWFANLTIIPIHDVYGSTLENKELEAILVTPHSFKGAEIINNGRKDQGLPELIIHICDLFSDDSSQVLSSSRVRAGLVNRSGFVYSLLFIHTLKISDEIKAYVRKPLGESHFTFPDKLEGLLVFVGDLVTETAVRYKLPISSAWIDGRSNRATYELTLHEPYRLENTALVNTPGTINADVSAFMEKHLISRNVVYRIGGEEDLLTLAAILLTPLNSRVIYGNAYGQRGVTVVHVTEEKKEEIRSLLESLI